MASPGFGHPHQGAHCTATAKCFELLGLAPLHEKCFTEIGSSSAVWFQEALIGDFGDLNGRFTYKDLCCSGGVVFARLQSCVPDHLESRKFR